ASASASATPAAALALAAPAAAVERVAGRLCGMRFQPPAALLSVVAGNKIVFLYNNSDSGNAIVYEIE
ncbi:MAG: hypothetical protein ACLSEH_04815, partial [Alistipes onderdonkii]